MFPRASAKQMTFNSYSFRSLILSVLILSALNGASEAAAEERIRIPGTKASLVPPPDFVLAETFPGVLQEETSSSVVITVIDPFPEDILEIVEPGALATQGMSLVDAQEVNFPHIDGEQAILAVVTQDLRLQGPDGLIVVSFRKWLGLLQMGGIAITVAGTCPDELSAALGPALKESILSLAWHAVESIDAFDGLPFRIAETEKLRIESRFSNMLILEFVNDDSDQGDTGSVYVGSSIGESRSDNLGLVAKARVLQLYDEDAIVFYDEEDTTLAGLPAKKVMALVRDEAAGAPIGFYQTIAIRDSVYYFVQATVRSDRSEELVAEYKKIVSSFVFVD